MSSLETMAMAAIWLLVGWLIGSYTRELVLRTKADTGKPCLIDGEPYLVQKAPPAHLATKTFYRAKCEECGRLHAPEFEGDDFYHITPHRAIAQAKADLWEKEDGRLLCPECRAAMDMWKS